LIAQVSSPTVLRIHPTDNVVIARRQLVGGTVLAQEEMTRKSLALNSASPRAMAILNG
jgi:Flp pilus assembly protein CpaB